MLETIFHGSLAFLHVLYAEALTVLSLLQDILLYGEQSWNIECLKVFSVPIVKDLDSLNLGLHS